MKRQDAREGEERPKLSAHRSPQPRLVFFHKLGRFFTESEWFWSAVFLLVVFAIFANHFRVQPPPLLPVGSIAPNDIRAPFDLQVVDEVATSQRKQDAKAAVFPVYDWDSGLGAELRTKVRVAFAAARPILETYKRNRKAHPLKWRQRRAAEKALDERLSEAMGGNLSDFTVRQFRIEGFSEKLESSITTVVGEVEKRKISPTGERFQGYDTIRVRDIRNDGAERDLANPAKNGVISLSTARRLPGTLLEGLPGMSGQIRGAVEEYVRSLLRANLTYDSRETGIKRDAAAAQVEPLVVFLKKGQVLVKAGAEVNESAYQELTAYGKSSRNVMNTPLLSALFLFLILMLLFTFLYLKSYRKHYRSSFNLFVLTLQVASGFMVLSQAMIVLMRLIVEGSKLQWLERATNLAFIIPVAAGALLMTLLADRHVAVIYTLLFSILFGILVDFNYGMFLFCILSSATAIYVGASLGRRLTYWQAGLIIALVNVPLAAGVLFTNPGWAEMTYKEFFVPIVLAFGAGFPLTIMLVVSFLPFFEGVFGILTEERLLALSTMNHSLLEQLSLVAPGTYNHSLMMASLSEAAANAVKADGLFCRVACYYHDVGKMLNAGYYVENLQGGPNPHNKFSPRVSAIIALAHVKDGIALARQYKLPQAIVDIIPQHHGTRRISYFLDLALTMNDPTKESVNEADFRYKGPKPQTREAAIIMMADSVEAASRTLRDPSHQRVTNMVDEIVERITGEGQLEECDLTFEDVAKVKASFVNFVMGIYSRRVSYPNYAFDKENKNGVQRSQAAQQAEKPQRS